MSMSEQERRADEATAEMTDEITTLADEAESAVDAQRDQTAEALQEFADTIQEKTGAAPGGDPTTAAGAAMAHGLERTADAVYANQPRQMVGRVQSVLRGQPLAAVFVGVVIGFIAGRMSR